MSAIDSIKSTNPTNPGMMIDSETRLALLEKSVNSQTGTIREGLNAQVKHLDRVSQSLEKIRDRMEQSFDMMSKNMSELNSTMYQQGLMMINYLRWYNIMGIVTVVAVCILAGSNFYFKWKEIELRSGSQATHVITESAQAAGNRETSEVPVVPRN